MWPIQFEFDQKSAEQTHQICSETDFANKYLVKPLKATILSDRPGLEGEIFVQDLVNTSAVKMKLKEPCVWPFWHFCGCDDTSLRLRITAQSISMGQVYGQGGDTERIDQAEMLRNWKRLACHDSPSCTSQVGYWTPQIKRCTGNLQQLKVFEKIGQCHLSVTLKLLQELWFPLWVYVTSFKVFSHNLI